MNDLPPLPGDGPQDKPGAPLPGGEPGTNENQDTTGVLKPGPADNTSETGVFRDADGKTLEEQHKESDDAKLAELLAAEVQAHQDTLARVESLSLLPPGSLAEAAIAEMFGPYETYKRMLLGMRQAAVNLRSYEGREYRLQAARLDAAADVLGAPEVEQKLIQDAASLQ